MFSPQILARSIGGLVSISRPVILKLLTTNCVVGFVQANVQSDMTCSYPHCSDESGVLAHILTRDDPVLLSTYFTHVRNIQPAILIA